MVSSSFGLRLTSASKDLQSVFILLVEGVDDKDLGVFSSIKILVRMYFHLSVGSLGIPRVSGQRNRSSLCVSDADQHEMARSQVPRSIYASEPTVDQGKEEEETAGRRTPINNGSPEASGSGTLLGMTQSAHQLQQQVRES